MSEESIQELELISTIGFNGSVPHGLLVHPDGEHLIYPLGCTVVIENIKTHEQNFLSGHTNDVSCLAVSKSGKYVASGQITHMGFKADVIVWDFEAKAPYATFTLHKVKVEALAFSPSDKYLVTLGGRDDSSVVVWDLEMREALCGAPSALQSAGTVYTVQFMNTTDDKFVTGGNKTLRIWDVDRPNRKIRPQECDLGQLKRDVRCILIDSTDEFLYAGTTSGDILQITIKTHLFKNSGPSKDKYSLGVHSIAMLKDGSIIVATGGGIVCALKAGTFKPVAQKECTLDGGATSVAVRGIGHQVYVGVNKGNIYRINFSDFQPTCINSCHYSGVLDVGFPHGCGDLFATCGKENIRVWVTDTSTEVLRVSVPNMTCHGVCFMTDGHSIISAWNDGKIRAFKPQSGAALYTIHDAHKQGVTAIATTSNSSRIVSGGGEGQVRVWDISSNRQEMKAAMKEHKGVVTCIKIRANNMECVSSSDDGTCIIWDLNRFVRNQIIFANTLFKAVCYQPEETQLLTGGSDRKISYWETLDGSQIREMEGSADGSINGLDISDDGNYFVSGGNSRKVKVWKYNEGEVTHVGLGHSGDITRVRVCPNSKHIISVSADGAILRWKYPF
ncbi:cilia- and flagella-associated protein 52-like [Bolinopsis microptera]|uniref:cilia- and flagella-associated protein 52-like n=1 Tax=Bolinopsis microptera TaxID=2820187 RepID=UPI0030791654